MHYSSDNRAPFIRITLLEVFLTVSDMADAHIHYNCINNTVFVTKNVALGVMFCGKILD